MADERKDFVYYRAWHYAQVRRCPARLGISPMHFLVFAYQLDPISFEC